LIQSSTFIVRSTLTDCSNAKKILNLPTYILTLAFLIAIAAIITEHINFCHLGIRKTLTSIIFTLMHTFYRLTIHTRAFLHYVCAYPFKIIESFKKPRFIRRIGKAHPYLIKKDY
ncbi:MAG: hypothetical protein ACFFBD_29840, partial [Candidatus Hodarchaeota archaeon]